MKEGTAALQIHVSVLLCLSSLTNSCRNLPGGTAQWSILQSDFDDNSYVATRIQHRIGCNANLTVL